MSQLFKRADETTFSRFKSKTRREEGCLLWMGVRNNMGYGQFWFKGKHGLAHRAAWELTFGPIPKGLNVLHHCDNQACVDPTHLTLGTQADNAADMVAKGRSTRNTRLVSHCPQGHEYTKENTLIRRACLTCERVRWRRKRNLGKQND